jgi:uncharacterized protein (TIGR02145 family)
MRLINRFGQTPAIVAALIAASVGTTAAQTGTVTDSRDKQTYKTVTVGTQTWMAENLNYPPKTGNSWCYNNSADSCKKFGRLYDWETAKTVCPAGWKLPDTADWRKLVKTAGGQEIAGEKLKSTSGWKGAKGDGNGADVYGFSALPGGYRDSDGSFYHAGGNGCWWTATEVNSDNAYFRGIYSGQDNVSENNYGYKNVGDSVRCVKE